MKLKIRDIQCEVIKEDFICKVVKKINKFSVENIELKDNELELYYNEEAGLHLIRVKNGLSNYKRYEKIVDVLVEHFNYGEDDELNFTNLILKKLFKIEESKGYIGYSSLFNDGGYYYISMPYVDFLNIPKKYIE